MAKQYGRLLGAELQSSGRFGDIDCLVPVPLHRRRKQTHKDRQARMDNMKEVFAVRHPEYFENKHILLVDDIITTGATTENCYHALCAVPNLRISIASLAVTSS